MFKIIMFLGLLVLYGCSQKSQIPSHDLSNPANQNNAPKSTLRIEDIPQTPDEQIIEFDR